jgi:NADH:ubiquinone oxidoreductase subunit 4 (subunit M)
MHVTIPSPSLGEFLNTDTFLMYDLFHICLVSMHFLITDYTKVKVVSPNHQATFWWWG